MSEEVNEPVLVWVEGTSKEGVYVSGFLNDLEQYSYFGIAPRFADVMERLSAEMLIRNFASTEPGLTFVIKRIQ